MPIIETYFAEFARLDFQTHLKYASTLARLSGGISVSCSITPTINVAQLDQVDDKLRLIELTRQSIEDECRIVELDQDFSSASVLWLPIKSYYLIYHLLSIIDFILTGQNSSLRVHHGELSNRFTNKLGSDQIQFSQPLFNCVCDQSIFNFKSKPGEHLSSSVADPVIYNLIMKKTATYKKNEHKVNAKLNLRMLVDRGKMKNYLTNRFKVSIFDYFYQMRIKLNYRDFDFVSGVSANATKRYFNTYHEMVNNFYNCFENLRSQLIANIR
jgi:hypothetical protein